MLLVADVGNTHLHLGLYDGERLVRTARLLAEDLLAMDEAWRRFVDGLPEPVLEGTVLCSVNPKVKIPFSHWIGQRFGRRPLVVGEGLELPIPLEVDDPHEVGADRIVNAFAALRLCGQGPLVVVDFGTAITLDVVSETGAYLGGAIAPGVETAARALAARTALLPYVRVAPAERAIGRNTIEALRSGLWFGLRGLFEALCARVIAELPRPPRLLATGGDAALMVEGSSLGFELHPHLTLEGLRLAWQERGAP
ncbi:MAG: type III pantothenate kinase [Planctomycetota bacterium]|nr:MAG: type III pantothenate kinase [Planctomycetota bacterium]